MKNSKLPKLKKLSLLTCRIFTSLCLIFFLENHPVSAQEKDYTLTVTSEQMQEFFGLGFSIHKAKDYFLPSNATVRQKLYSGTFSGFNTVSFWSYIENPSLRDQFITEAKKYGLKRVIVNPTGMPITPMQHANQQFMDLKEYIQSDYPIYGTTIMNKPNTDESDTKRVSPAFLAESAKLLRAKLDSAGYSAIKIGGPSTIEWAPYIDPTLHGAAHGYGFIAGDNMMYLNGLINDPDALNILSGFDFQSYGWSVSEEIQLLADQYGKELWISLSATDGENNNNGDPILSPISAANLLANINHGVKHWNYWVWDQLVNFSTGELNKRGKVLQQIGANFREGAIVRKCVSDPFITTNRMFWNYFDVENPSQKKQPEFVASAAKNTDNSFVIAMVNLTGVHAQHFYSRYYENEAAVINVKITIEELNPNEIGLFQVHQIKPDGTMASSGQSFLKKNLLTASMGSQNMVILKADTIHESDEVLLEEHTPVISAANLNEEQKVELTWQDNSPNESGFLVERKLEGGDEYLMIASLTANTSSYVDYSELSNEASYQYRVSAIGQIHIGEQVFADTAFSQPYAITINYTGLEGINIHKAGIAVYPNPSIGIIRLGSSTYNEKLLLEVYDMTGKRVTEKYAWINQDVDLSFLPDGMYNLKVIDGKDFIFKKIILIR